MQKPRVPSSIWLIFIGLAVVTLLGVFGGGGAAAAVPP